MTVPLLIAAAWGFEALIGWPMAVYRRMGHPVVWIGWLIQACETGLNRSAFPPALRYAAGALTSLCILAVATGLAILLSLALPPTWWGFAIEAVLASSMIASRSLYQHVSAVLQPLQNGDLTAARIAVGNIVGRDPAALSEEAVTRASLESLAENASDGVIAPVVWGLVFGLPGMVAYKTVNTLDSMIGHRTPRHAAFGGFAARLDDIANIIPARITGLFLAVASLRWAAFVVMFRDAGKHRSPNAGWPEAAMAGGLGVRLSGPRAYAGETVEEPWLHPDARDPSPQDLSRGMDLYLRAMALGGSVLIPLAAGFHYAT